MGIAFGEEPRTDRQKIEEAMSLIRTWVKPEELKYDEDLDCLSFVRRDRNDEPHYLYIFNIRRIGIEPDMLSLHTYGGSTIYIHDSGMVSVMTH